MDVLVAGGGAVALRRARALAACGARVRVVAPEHDRGFSRLRVRCIRSKFRASHLGRARFVFATTDDAEANAAIARAARKRGCLVNRADLPGDSDFQVPASFRRGPLTLAISTGGASPALARRLRVELPALAAVAREAERLRKSVLASRLPPARRRALLQSLAPRTLFHDAAAVRRDMRRRVRAAL